MESKTDFKKGAGISSGAIVAVTGATGNQGGSVCKYLLKDGKFKVRALTRNPNSDKARELAAMGAEVIQADLNKREDLERAFDGVSAVFGVTNFFEHGAEGEVKQGKFMADAAKGKGVQMFIFSTLAYASKISQGRLPVEHFDSKGQIEEYVRSKGFQYTGFPMVGYYMEDWFAEGLNFEQGMYVIKTPLTASTILPQITVSEMGMAVLAMLNEPERWNGKVLPINTGENLTLSDIARIFGEVTKKPCTYKTIPIEQYEKGNKEFGHMYRFIQEYGVFGPNADTNVFKSLYPQVTTWKQFVERNFTPLTEPAM